VSPSRTHSATASRREQNRAIDSPASAYSTASKSESVRRRASAAAAGR